MRAFAWTHTLPVHRVWHAGAPPARPGCAGGGWPGELCHHSGDAAEAPARAAAPLASHAQRSGERVPGDRHCRKQDYLLSYLQTLHKARAEPSAVRQGRWQDVNVVTLNRQGVPFGQALTAPACLLIPPEVRAEFVRRGEGLQPATMVATTSTFQYWPGRSSWQQKEKTVD